MKSKMGKILFGLATFLACGAGAQAADFTAAANGNWATASTWTLNSGTDADGIPDADDTATIPSPRTVSVAGAQSALVLTVNGGGTLTLNSGSTLTLSGAAGSSFINGGTVNGSGTFRTQGAVSFNSFGTFGAPFVIASGTTSVTGNSILGGAVTVSTGATLDTGGITFTVNGVLTVDAGGTITDTNSFVVANGASVVNNGTISILDLRFGRTVSTTNLSGSGTFTKGIRVLNGATASLVGSATFGNGGTTATNFDVDSGGTLALISGTTLTLNGVGFTNGGTVSGAGTFRTQGTTSFNSFGTFSAPFVVLGGTTSVVGNSTFGGAVTISNGATLNTGGITVTINGTLIVSAGGSIVDTNSFVVANGTSVVNDGSISILDLRFGRTTGGGTTLSGSGTFTKGIRILDDATVSVTSGPAVTFGNGGTTATNFNIDGDSGTLALNFGSTLTLNGVGFTNGGTVSGLGTFRTQGASSINSFGTFTAPFVVGGGTTSVVGNSTFGGAVTISNGATLNTGGITVTINGTLTVNAGGTITDTNSFVNAGGASVVNDGLITILSLRFNRSGGQTLSGAGSVSSANILSGSTVTLGSNHQFGRLIIDGGGAFSTSSFTASLSGAGTPLTNSGTAITAGNFTYNGTAAQTVQSTNVNYSRLGINNAAGVALAEAETVAQRLILTNGAFNNGGFLTLTSGATIERGSGTLQTAPTFAGTINLEYTGAGGVTTGVEFPTTTNVTNLIINKTAATNTVTLNADRTVNGALTLTGGRLVTNSFVLILSASGTTAVTNGFVIGFVRKFNPAANFVYPVGTDNGYSPVTIVAVTGTGNLTVRAVQAQIPNAVNPNRGINRHWNLTNSGLTSARLRFQYLDADVPSPALEPQFRIIRDTNGAPPFVIPDGDADNVDDATNVATLITATTTFSNWTVGDNAVVTSAPADIAGRVVRRDGSPLAGARVSAINSASSESVSQTTDAAGNYLFPAMRTGETYLIGAARRGYVFSPANRLLNHTGAGENLTFTATRDLSKQEATSGSDFDGDGRADLAVFRPENGFWYIKRSSDNSVFERQFGASGDVPTAGDYDGDGKSDFAVFRPSGNVWYSLRSSDNTFAARQFGASGDVPVHSDYDGDGVTDIAVYRPTEGVWYIWRSASNEPRAEQFGTGEDKTVPADYDGDGVTDIAVYRPAEGVWYIRQSASGAIRAARFGVETDQPAVADFDGDGKSDVAVYRRSEGVWHILGSAGGIHRSIRWGAPGDVLVPADYDGDGRADAAVFRKGVWHLQSSGGDQPRSERFGEAEDQPIPQSFRLP